MDAIHGVKFLNASLCYLNRNILFETVKPYRLIGVDPIETVPLTNLEFGVNADMKIEDFRDVNNDLSLEKNAFKLYEWPSNISPRATPDEIREYCKSMAEIVKEELGAEAVFVYDHRVRKSEGEKNSASRILGNLGERAFELPIDAVHIDLTRKGGWRRIRSHLTEEERLKYFTQNYRVRVVNIWRCFTQFPDMPLALCLPNSVETADLVATDTITPERRGQMYYLHHNPQHKWYWASNMKSTEVLAFTTWSSDTIEKGTICCPHTAFPYPLADKRLSQRESLEIRVIVMNVRRE